MNMTNNPTGDPGALSLPDLRAERDALRKQEDAVSFVRRLAQGRVDLVTATPGPTGQLHQPYWTTPPSLLDSYARPYWTTPPGLLDNSTDWTAPPGLLDNCAGRYWTASAGLLDNCTGPSGQARWTL